MPFSEARRQERGNFLRTGSHRGPSTRSSTVSARRALEVGSLNEPVLHFGILQRIGVLYVAAFLVLRWRTVWQSSLAAALLFLWWHLWLSSRRPV